MITLYWLLEYGKVFIAYMVLVFVWPSLMFRKYLKGKSLTFRFGFCATVSMLVINTTVLVFGLVGLLHMWLLWLLFYGGILVAVYRAIPDKRNKLKQAGRVVVGTYGMKQLLYRGRMALGSRLGHQLKILRNKIKGHMGEFVLLGVVICYGMIYFSYGAFQTYSYGSSDMYPHTAWIYGLTQGNVFTAGVYPEGMHCFIYALHTLFGIRIYSCMLFTEGIHILTFLLSVYCFLKEIFRSRYTPILALTLFLTVDVIGITEVYSMARLQWTIPQEFGFYTMFLCAAFLVRYLKGQGSENTFGQTVWSPLRTVMKKWVVDENLLIFLMALAVSLTVHFYPTIMAFFLCLAFVPLNLHKILRPKRLLPLVASVGAGCMIAVVPMALALAMGMPFQGSIGWAVNVIQGNNADEENIIVIDERTGEKVTEDLSYLLREEAQPQNGEESGGGTTSQNQPVSQDVTAPQSQTPSQDVATPQPVKKKSSFFERVKRIGKGAGFALYKIVRNLYWFAYVALYRQKRADFLIRMSVLAVILFLLCRIAGTIYARVSRKDDVRTDAFDGYLGLVLASVFFMMMFAADSIGLPTLISGSRLCSIAHLLLLGVCVVPVDVVLYLWQRRRGDESMTKLAAALVFMIYLGTILFGCFHGYLYFELSRYNGAVMVTDRLNRTMEPYSYTVISTVDELYHMIQYGYHEEAIRFVNEMAEEDYVLPTEYVFLYVEKHPIQYGQNHFFTGPGWLARSIYTQYYEVPVSEGDRIINGTISPELAKASFYRYPISSKAYTSLFSRMMVESCLQKWCNDFEKLYPGELHMYYEDEDFACYYFRQNPDCLYQLAIE